MEKLNWYVTVSAVGVLLAVVVFSGLAISYWCVNKARKRNTWNLSATSSASPSCLSPDILTRMVKYSLKSYCIEELREATGNFCEETKLGETVHKGWLWGVQVAIKEMSSSDAQRTINIYSKINHANILILHGVCYGENHTLPSYLVFEFARHGCLRDRLDDTHDVLPWSTRKRIVLDVAVGLHYIHHCTIPSYIHMNISSRNVLITEDWRAKMANFGATSFVKTSPKEECDIVPLPPTEGCVAPEFLLKGMVSVKIDVFAFGVVLLEIISALNHKEVRCFRESLGFYCGGGSESVCSEELRAKFMDPRLRDYSIGEALCLVVLAKACLEDDPSLQRPSMDHIPKILARMVL